MCSKKWWGVYKGCGVSVVVEETYIFWFTNRAGMNKVMRSLLLGSYIWFFGWGLLGPLYAVFAQKIGGDILEMTGAYALYLIVGGLFSIGFGKYSDHVSKEKMMVAGYMLNAAATFGYLLVDTPIKLFIVQALLGLANALATPT